MYNPQDYEILDKFVLSLKDATKSCNDFYPIAQTSLQEAYKEKVLFNTFGTTSYLEAIKIATNMIKFWMV